MVGGPPSRETVSILRFVGSSVEFEFLMKASRRPVGDHATLPSRLSLVRTFFKLSPLASITQSSWSWPLIKAIDELSGEVPAGHACSRSLRGLPPKTETSQSTLPSASVAVLRRRFSPSENH